LPDGHFLRQLLLAVTRYVEHSLKAAGRVLQAAHVVFAAGKVRCLAQIGGLVDLPRLW